MRSPLPALLLAACACTPAARVEDIDIGADVQLTAAASAWRVSDRFLVASVDGRVIDQDGRSFELSPGALRDLAYDREHERWWAVGEGGFVAFADERDDGELEWIALDPGTTADLEAIALWQDESAQVVVVGDGVVRVGTAFMPANYHWIEPTPPASGWGQLRDVEFVQLDEPSVWAVGEAGRVLAAYPDLERWTDESPGIDADLECAGAHWAAGADAVVLERGAWLDAWSSREVTPTIDLLDCADTFIGADRRLYSLQLAGREGDSWRLRELVELDWQPHAFDQYGALIVGDDGHVARWFP